MSSASRIHAISFDADDTLWDAQSAILLALEPSSAMFDTPVAELQRVRNAIANEHSDWNMETIRVESWRRVLIARGIEPDNNVLDDHWKTFTKLRLGLTQLYDETTEVLELLRQRGLRLAVLSNAHMDLRVMKIDHFFDEIFLAEHTQLRKPNIEAFDQVTSAFGLAAEQILHIGDSITDDHEAATKHGFQSLLLCRAHSNACEHDDRFVIDLRQVIPLL